MNIKTELKYIYSILSFKDKLWLKIYPNRKEILNQLAYYIKPSYIYEYNVSDFNFIEDKKYCEVIKEYYKHYEEYENMTIEEQIIELRKGIKSIYRNCNGFKDSDITVPDKFKPFISIHGNYINEKFPIPFSMKDDFIRFLFHYLQKNTYLLRTHLKVIHMFPEIIHNSYFKDNEELFELSDTAIKEMYSFLLKQYS